jgi:DNA-binding XRE family transcriptional regulator
MAKTRSGAAITTPRKRRVTPREYRAAFAARVRQARTAARYPVDEMALPLGVTRDTYNKYEGRGASLMPHNLYYPRHSRRSYTSPSLVHEDASCNALARRWRAFELKRAAVALERETR